MKDMLMNRLRSHWKVKTIKVHFGFSQIINK